MEQQFENRSVFYLIEPDINQEVYRLPEHLSALNSAWLNESATLYRRECYLNGSHAGAIFYMTGIAQQQSGIDAFREVLTSSKGSGNFRNIRVCPKRKDGWDSGDPGQRDRGKG